MAGNETGNGGTWYVWASSSDSTDTADVTGCSDNASTWRYWTASTTSASTIWYTWTNTATNTNLPSRKRTKEELKALEAQRRDYEARLAEERKKREEAEKQRAAAEKRAAALLLGALSLTQRKEYEQHRYFTVIGGKTRRVYRIKDGTHGNIEELDANGNVVATLCVQPDGVPKQDANLAQKLMLENCEDEILRVANRRPRMVA